MSAVLGYRVQALARVGEQVVLTIGAKRIAVNVADVLPPALPS